MTCVDSEHQLLRVIPLDFSAKQMSNAPCSFRWDVSQTSCIKSRMEHDRLLPLASQIITFSRVSSGHFVDASDCKHYLPKTRECFALALNV